MLPYIQVGAVRPPMCSVFVCWSVPVIVENQCRTYTYSIQLHSPSPLTCGPLHASTGVEHYLLHREAAVCCDADDDDDDDDISFLVKQQMTNATAEKSKKKKKKHQKTNHTLKLTITKKMK